MKLFSLYSALIISVCSMGTAQQNSPLSALKKYAGYPLCSDVVNTFKSNLKTAIESNDPQTAHLVEQFYSYTGNTASNQRNEEITHQERQESSGFSQGWSAESAISSNYRKPDTNYCFVSLTPVQQLQKDKTTVKTVNISSLQQGHLVLGSTFELFHGHAREYVTDCWTSVHSITVSNGYNKNSWHDTDVPLKSIVVQNNKNEKITLSCTPNHRFCRELTANQYLWDRARHLDIPDRDQKLARLYSPNQSRVVSVADSNLEEFIEKREDANANSDTENLSAYVYNLSTDSYTYYVGTMTNRVLTHNIK